MNILAIESSCDETAAAIISGDPKASNPPKLLANVVVSQIDIFKEYGGVIPEVAARSHLEAILPVIHRAFKEAGFTKNTAKNSQKTKNSQSSDDETDQDDWSKIDAIAVTHTPGLLGSLLIGTLTARTLAILHKKPLYAVHHLKSHIYATWLIEGNEGNTSTLAACLPADKQQRSAPVKTGGASVSQSRCLPSFPLLALVISGGHTQIIYMKKHNNFKIIGTTLDDAVGECFDKVAKILGLPYPGGPSIANAAKGIIPSDLNNSPNSTQETQKPQEASKKAQAASKFGPVAPGDPRRYHFPHPNAKSLDFSFSGLKTAVLRAVQQELKKPISFPSHELAPLLSNQQKADFAASFQEVACDILLEKLEKAIKEYPDVKSIVIAGGVSASAQLRWKSQKFSTKINLPIYFPERKFSGDNAAMVGIAAFYEISSKIKPTDPYKLNILPRSEIK